MPDPKGLLQSLIGILEEEYQALLGNDARALHRAAEEKRRLTAELEARVPDLKDAELKALVLEAQALNQRNGTVISLSLRHVQNALALLRGEGLYGPQARPVHPRQSRPIAKV